MRRCEVCGEEIPEIRLKVLPTARRCVKCQEADEKANPGKQKRGIMIYDHKTAGHIQIVDRDTLERMNEMDRRGIPRKRLE